MYPEELCGGKSPRPAQGWLVVAWAEEGRGGAPTSLWWGDLFPLPSSVHRPRPRTQELPLLRATSLE